MTTNVNFDELAKKAFAPGATSDDYENLFAAAFSLPEWYFVADGEFEYKMPYCAIFPDYFGDAIALTVFTDGERARKFIAEKGIAPKSEDIGKPSAPQTTDDLILRISTNGILDFFDRLAPLNIAKIFFNPNKDSHGFHHDLKMMRPIYDHLENKGLLGKTKPETAVEDSENHLSKLIEENADVIAEFDRENELLSSIIAGSAAALDDDSDEEDRERVISNTAEMFESLRKEYKMPPKVFRIYIESCLNERKLLMPVLAFAYLRQDKLKWEKLEQDKEFIDEYARWTITKLVPGSEILMDEPSQKSAGSAGENVGETGFQNTAANEPDEKKSVESDVDFDQLSRTANGSNGTMEDLNELFGEAFALEKWDFIARGEMPNVNPYVAARADVADGQQMIRAFTDGARLQRFAKENNLTREDGAVDVLSVPTAGIVEYLEQFMEYGVYGVWFNSDVQSDGFFIPLKQLQPIKDHLAKINWQKKGSAREFQSDTDFSETSVAPTESEDTTVIITISDGLMMPSGSVSKSPYNCNFFCWLPSEWTENFQLKPEYLEKLYEQFYGASWRSGNSDGSRYVVLESNSAVMSPERSKETKWNVVQNTELNHYWFYIADRNGTFKNVSAEEYQAHFDAYFQKEKRDEAMENQDRLADWGMSETPDGDLDLNLSINKVGAVNFDASIAPFYEAIVPLLKDFRGTGDYVTLLRFEPSGKSQEVENIAENEHGAYLQIRRFLYLNPKNGVRIGVNSIHSSYLRHVRSNAELLVSIELCKNLDNQTAVFYHAVRGPKSDVLSLIAAIQPILESVGYDPVQ